MPMARVAAVLLAGALIVLNWDYKTSPPPLLRCPPMQAETRPAACPGPVDWHEQRHALRANGWAMAMVYVGRTPSPALAARWTSQDGQDRTVASLFREKRGGFFVDLAANDAVVFSNTLTLEQEFGWDGLCIEANPKYYEGLYQRKCLVVQAAVGRQDGEMAGFALRDGLGGLVGDGFDNREAASAQVITVSVASLFRDMRVPREVDYLSLDIEGAEEWAFETFPWTEYRIMVITVERPKARLRETLANLGYVYVRDHGNYGDQLWIHPAFPDLHTAVARLPVL